MNELIKAAQKGVQNHELPGLFTAKEFKDYVIAKGIEKAPGVPYKTNYLNAVLSNSSLKNRGTKNYDKVLGTLKHKRKQHYYFRPQTEWVLQ